MIPARLGSVRLSRRILLVRFGCFFFRFLSVRPARIWFSVRLSWFLAAKMKSDRKYSEIVLCLKTSIIYLFRLWDRSKKMRLDESFHMRYTMLQNTLLVTSLKHFCVWDLFEVSKMSMRSWYNLVNQCCIFQSLSWCISAVIKNPINLGVLITI